MDSLDKFRLSSSGMLKMGDILSKRPPRPKPGKRFLKGPVPLDWIKQSAKLPGKAPLVGIIIWFKAGVTNQRTVTLPGKVLREFNIGRRTGYRALKALEEAHLISVTRHQGRCPRITILE